MRVRGFEVVSRLERSNVEVKLPRRSTKDSAGYDFFAYEDVTIPPSITFHTMPDENRNFKKFWDIKPTYVPTGIKAYMREDEELDLYNRSSNPKKLGLILPHSVGIVDSDFYNNPDNDGEIQFSFYNLLPVPVTIKKGDKIGQGIFRKFLKADFDDSDEARIGGMGSTGN